MKNITQLLYTADVMTTRTLEVDGFFFGGIDSCITYVILRYGISYFFFGQFFYVFLSSSPNRFGWPLFFVQV